MSLVQCVILAGGMATRMKDVTGDQIPKFLIPIEGKPFAHYQLSQLQKQGITHVVLSIGFLGHKIREYVGTGKKWNLEVSYVDEGTELRGTAGALRLALDQGVLQPRFFVIYGDSYLDTQYLPVLNKFDSIQGDALMTVLLNRGQWDLSNACFDGNHVTYYEADKSVPRKSGMDYVDYGLSVMSGETIKKEVPAEKVMQLPEVFQRLSLQGRLLGFKVKERFYEIGSKTGLDDFKKLIRKNGE